MARTQLLYQLQNLDLELDQARKELAGVKAALGESQALQQARQAVEDAAARLRQAQTRMQDLDLEVGSLTAKIAREEKALYGGKPMSAKEAANLQEEIASLKRRQEKQEELLLEAMVEVEEAEAHLDRTQAELAAVQSQWEADQAGLIQQQQALESKIAELTERRPELVEMIPGDILAIYEDMRPRKAGRAVAAVKNGVCQGCNVMPSHSEIQQARSGQELVYCSACGRILHVL